MTLNTDKCHIAYHTILYHTIQINASWQRCDNPVTVGIGSSDVENSSEEKLLGPQGPQEVV